MPINVCYSDDVPDRETRSLRSFRSHVPPPPGEPLPFEDASFDGVTAGSSIEQTPDAKATLAELCRVLKPGGRWMAGSSHSIGNFLPHENVLAMINAIHKYGVY